MNVESSSAAAASSTTTSTQQAAQVQKTSSDKSFDEELKSVQKTETQPKDEKTKGTASKDEEKVTVDNATKTETSKDTAVNILVSKDIAQNPGNSIGIFGEISNNNMFDENGFMINNGMSLKDNVQTYLKNNGLQLQNLNNAFQYKGADFSLSASKSSLDYSTVKMDDNDAKFFADLVQKTDMSMQSVATEIQKAADMGNVQQVQKSANVSAALMNALSDAVKTNQPIRIDFDKDVSIIIKVDKDGSITANFIPGDKAVEQYLKENMASLRQRFDDQNISYKELSYSNSKQQQNQKRNNKENK